MDILHLVDRLEEVFNAGGHIPLTRNLIVDEDRVLDLIDQMRVSIPEEVKKAQQVLAQRDRILAQAHEEAERTIQLAKEKSNQLVERDAMVESAKTRATQIAEEARQKAEEIRSGADEYVLEVLTNLELEMIKSLGQVQNGISKLKGTPAAQPPAPTGS